MAMTPERTLWWRLIRATVGGAATTGFRMRVEGTDHLPDSGGALLVFNHVSVLDVIFVAIPVVDRGRSVTTMGLAEDFERPLLGSGIRRLGQIPVSRGAGDWAPLEQMAEVLRSGRLAAIAPEGTVGDGSQLQKGQKGAARIALLAGTPVLPVAVWGAQRRWDREGWRFDGPLRPIVGVVYGPPIDVQGDAKHRPDVQALTDRIMGSLEALVVRARRIAPGRD